MGILYLIQPAELIGTNHYKIGCSSKSSIDRVKYGYKKGTRYLIILECDNAFDIEKNLKDVFNENFTLIAGREFFKGDENEMLKLFYNTYLTNKNIGVDTKQKIQETLYQEKCDEEYHCDEEDFEANEESDEESDEETIEDFDGECDVKYICEVKSKHFCEKCNYKTIRKSQYERHLLTKKHKTTKIQQNQTYNCECGKEYTHRASLFNHKKKCNYKEEKQEEETNEKVDYKNLFIQMLNHNKELQELMISQQEEFMKQQKDLFIKQQEDTNKKFENQFENLILHIRNTN